MDKTDYPFRPALRWAYRSVMDRLPRHTRVTLEFLKEHRTLPDLDRPRTFSEFVQYRKLNEANPKLIVYADKIAVKVVVTRALGPDWVIPTLWSGKTLPVVHDWPVPFIVKANHAAGWNYFVRQPSDLDWAKIEAATNQWLSTPWYPRLCEDYYNQFERQLLIEPLLGDPDKGLSDYKFFVFGGRMAYVQVDTDRFGDHRRTFFDRDWKRQDFGLKFPLETRPIERPAHFVDMIRAAEILGRDFDFARVDLYDLPSGPKFGEVTFCPGSGYERFDPPVIDRAFGDLWRAALAK